MRVVELTAVRIPGAVHAETVAGARTVSGDVTMPDAGLRAEQCEAGLSPASSKMHMSTPEAALATTATSRPSPDGKTPRRVGTGFRFGDAHGGDAGRAGTLGHIKVPLS